MAFSDKMTLEQVGAECPGRESEKYYILLLELAEKVKPSL